MPLSQFHPLVQEWFRGRFESPTESQSLGWPAIAQGRHVLIAAPTGSGKTLAAFLACIDRLVRLGLQGQMPETTQAVYVSPLKALSNDILKNLVVPLQEISALAKARGTPLPEIRVAVRTGDTPASERQRMAKTPPHLLITTPESLYLLLTSRSGRQALRGVTTLILDEIHAAADDKRGSHLSLSVERLCALAAGRVARIGLSATQRPIAEMARLLVGSRSLAPDGTPDCVIVDTGHARALDLALRLPAGMELGPIATHELWTDTLDAIAELVSGHRTALVFVNTRRLVERVAHQLAARLGDDAVAPHHGSLSRTTRLAAEEKLKKGEVKVCVATASLELGIDIGPVDLVVQVGSPRSINTLLQRIGRSGHTLGGTPKGRLFPLTRDELVECAALTRAVRRRELDTVRIPPWPLDVLAQQIVAACSVEEWDLDDLYTLCTSAYPYRDLPRKRFDQVVMALTEGFAPRQGRTRALLHHDAVNNQLRARRGAQLIAVTNGGAIPDNADYDVIADPEGIFVGKVSEDFAVESMGGDVFLLGNTPWKIRRVENGRVRVENAQGQTPSVPFWLGEAPGRTWELSQEITAVREGVDQRLHEPLQAESWLTAECGVSQEAARQIVAYVAEGKRVLGIVPSARQVVAERFFDESGGMQLVIHAPFGAAINRAWGMALRKQICRTFDFELQASATDDGLNFSLGPSLSFPVSEVFTYLSSKTVEPVLRQAVLQAPVFGTRWRWDATRALALLRNTGGKKVPPPIQRMRSGDLLAAVFPAQVQCQDNATPGDIEVPDHPLVFETMRDCLTEAMDVDGLRRVLTAIERGEIELHARDTAQPSAFAHQLLNAMPYAFLDDAPLEERRARAVSLRRALPEDARDLSALDLAALLAESQSAWPSVRDADELHDALMTLGLLPEDAGLWRQHGVAAADAERWFAELAQAGRAYLLRRPQEPVAWVAAERIPLLRNAFPHARVEPEPPARFATPLDLPPEDALLSLVRGWVECSGPFLPSELARTLGTDVSAVQQTMLRLEGDGLVLRGRFRPNALENEFCDRRILARIHRATISGLRKKVEPAPAAAFLRFLLHWHHVEPTTSLKGEGGVQAAVAMLQGFEAPAGAWEAELLARRVADYQPGLLDGFFGDGELVWGRMSRHANSDAPTRATFSRNTPITLALREALDWLLETSAGGLATPPGGAEEVLGVLSKRGASFLNDVVSWTRRLPADVEETLWQLAATGRVTTDSFEVVRRRLNGTLARRRPARARPILARRLRSGRWSLLDARSPQEDRLEQRVHQLLARYGVLFPELLARESAAPRWREAVPLLRRLEARGEVYGGQFVAGFSGEQFALPEAVQALRQVRDANLAGTLVMVSACDPLNLAGILTPGERVPAVLGNQLIYRDGVPLCSVEGGELLFRGDAGPALVEEVRAFAITPHRHPSLNGATPWLEPARARRGAVRSPQQ